MQEGRLRVEVFPLGPLMANCYLVYETATGSSIIVDPGWPDGVEDVAKRVRELNLDVKAIIATHGHFDHVLGVDKLKLELGREAPFLIHSNDEVLVKIAGKMSREVLGVYIEPPEPDDNLDEGDAIKLGDIELAVWHTPGHSPGSICLVASRVVFTGDLIFRGSVGRTDIPLGSWNQLVQSLERILRLPNHTVLYPGHGEPTTIEYEKRRNPFIPQSSK